MPNLVARSCTRLIIERMYAGLQPRGCSGGHSGDQQLPTAACLDDPHLSLLHWRQNWSHLGKGVLWRSFHHFISISPLGIEDQVSTAAELSGSWWASCSTGIHALLHTLHHALEAIIIITLQHTHLSFSRRHQLAKLRRNSHLEFPPRVYFP